MRAIDVYFDAPRDARARAVLAARSSRTRLHRGIVLEAAHVQLGPAAVGVEGELWQPAARGSRWVCQGDQTSGWDRAVWSLISVFIRYANSLPLEDYCHSNKEIRPRSDPGAARDCAARAFGASVAAVPSRPRPTTRGRRAPRSPPLQPQQQPLWRPPLGMMFWKAMLQTRCMVLGLKPRAIGRTTRAMTMLSGTTKSAPFWGQLFWVASYYCTTAADQLGARQGHCA